MREEIKKLLELQEYNRIQADLERLLVELPELIEEETIHVRHSEENHAAAKEALNKSQLKRKAMEGEQKAAEDAIRKNKEQLNSLKSNEAYSKMTKEIDEKNKAIEEIEEKVLNILYDIEIKEKDIKTAFAGIATAKIEAEKKQNEFRIKIAALEKERAEVIDKINPIEAAINSPLLERYKKVRDKKGGIAVVPVEDLTCGGCHIQIPPQIINDIKEEKEIKSCESCNRFLYIKEE